MIFTYGLVKPHKSQLIPSCYFLLDLKSYSAIKILLTITYKQQTSNEAEI